MHTANLPNLGKDQFCGVKGRRSLHARFANGSHRRIRMEDVMGHKEKLDAERDGTLAELIADAEELDMGYNRPS